MEITIFFQGLYYFTFMIHFSAPEGDKSQLRVLLRDSPYHGITECDVCMKIHFHNWKSMEQLCYLPECYSPVSVSSLDQTLWLGQSEILVNMKHQKSKSVFTLGAINKKHNKNLQHFQVHLIVLLLLECTGKN